MLDAVKWRGGWLAVASSRLQAQSSHACGREAFLAVGSSNKKELLLFTLEGIHVNFALY
jgi:hypothetical protein